MKKKRDFFYIFIVGKQKTLEIKKKKSENRYNNSTLYIFCPHPPLFSAYLRFFSGKKAIHRECPPSPATI